MSIPASDFFHPGPLPLPPIHNVGLEQSCTWIGRGAADFVAYPGIGMAYGAAFALCGWLMTYGLELMGMGSLILPLGAGFLLVAPFLAVGLYDVSRRKERNLPVTWRHTLTAIARNPQMADMGLVLLLVFMAWFQVALVLFALFFGRHPPPLTEFVFNILMAPQGWAFLMTGTVVGALFAALAFSLAVVSMPMLLDRPVSAQTAMRTSLRAVWVNRRNMIGWAATLAVLGALGLGFLLIGLAVALPVAAHASWHAYRDLVGG